MGTEGMKRILDSVHGYVRIPEAYIHGIIDTPEFQRLRRIEQTSCRALFPSARHDRFIHSIGVYHLGSQIVEHLWLQAQKCSKEGDQTHFPLNGHTVSIVVTYLLACLLHDVGHTPFSHTFEQFFHNDQNDLLSTLSSLIAEDSNFKRDFETPMPDGEKNKLTPHEFCSAIIAVKNYEDIIKGNHKWKEFERPGDVALLARMIVGCRYFDNRKKPDKKKSLENCFIELIHSKIIDADGLDYVCRDVWASGYSTSKVDVSRLIDSIRIYNNNGEYSVCYDFKGINDVLSVLQVKSFQSEYVFSHHSVIFEQHLLVEAMKSAAIYHETKIKHGNDVQRKKALRKLCNLNLFTKQGHETKETKAKVTYVMDDDFVSLMKYCADDKYVQHWFSRQYDYIPIWKSRESLMSDLPKELKKRPIREEFWLYTDECLVYLSKLLKIKKEDIILLDVDITNRINRIMDIKLYVDHKVHLFNEIYKTINESGFKTPITFKLIYIPKSALKHKSLPNLKLDLINQCCKKYEK